MSFISNKLLKTCPVCQGELTITNLSCSYCQTKIEGSFHPCRFCRLPEEQLHFIEVFLKNRGNIKDVEKEMGISYPTVRNKLDGVLQALGYLEEKTDGVEDLRRQDILNALETGEMSPGEAARRLRKTK